MFYLNNKIIYLSKIIIQKLSKWYLVFKQSHAYLSRRLAVKEYDLVNRQVFFPHSIFVKGKPGFDPHILIHHYTYNTYKNLLISIMHE